MFMKSPKETLNDIANGRNWRDFRNLPRISLHFWMGIRTELMANRVKAWDWDWRFHID